MERVISSMLADAGVFHYPDAKIYNSAKLLTPEERGTAPVDFIDPKAPILRVRPGTEALADHDAKKISVNKEGSVYKDKDDRLLAAVLAHETQHLKEPRATNDQMPNEGPAYRVQRDVLRRLFYPNKHYMDNLSNRIRAVDEAYSKRRK